jgi:hypothetical protein
MTDVGLAQENIGRKLLTGALGAGSGIDGGGTVQTIPITPNLQRV